MTDCLTCNGKSRGRPGLLNAVSYPAGEVTTANRNPSYPFMPTV
jgi:hypothetical protein